MKQKKKRVIYTCITGKYDALKDHQYVSDEWDYICFSDNITASTTNGSWAITPLKHTASDDQRINRWHKINAHLCVEDYEHSVYIDANIDVLDKKFFDELDKQIVSTNIFSIMRHPDRGCVYKEAQACIELGKDTAEVIKPHMELYKKLKYPKNNGLFTSSILYRKHHDKKLIPMMEEWWHWLDNYSRRDQLSLPYVFWRHNFKPGILPFTYGLGKMGSLFYYPHMDGLKDYILKQHELANSLELARDNLIKSFEQEKAEFNLTLDSRNKQLELIEKSRIWKTRNYIMGKLRK